MNAAAQSISPSLPSDLSDAEFACMQRLALEWAGIKLEVQQRTMLYSRFSRRLRDLGLHCFSEYVEFAVAQERLEREYFVNTVTTNLTYFFREPHHFEHMVKEAVPTLLQTLTPEGKLRIWSAACSSGQEPYSVAIALASHHLLDQCETKILCTDINTDMVSRTRSGSFSVDALRGLSVQQQDKWFTKDQGALLAREDLRRLMLCKSLNLFGRWPFSAQVDIIFCRNALIYFDKQMQCELIARFAGTQRPGGYLYLGHSEVVQDINSYYERIENTVFRRLP